jgi:peptidoglycan/xylan/chitin deacetylase (PgdA/CDA1 family)
VAADLLIRAPRLLSAARLTRTLRLLGPWHGVLALAYQRVGVPGDSPFHHARYSVSPEALDAQLAVLAKQTDVIGPDDLHDVSTMRSGRYVLLSFDGGYRDAYEHALPLLRARGQTAAFFVATSFIDRPRVAWWDELAWMAATTTAVEVHLDGWLDVALRFDDDARVASGEALIAAYAALPSVRGADFLHAVADALGTGRCPPALGADSWLTWPMVRELRDAGMTIGGHSASHPLLARSTPARQHQEVSACAARLRRELDEPVDWFSYPGGGRDSFDAVTRAAVRDAGFRLAFSAYGGVSSFSRWDPLDVRRAVVKREVLSRAA